VTVTLPPVGPPRVVPLPPVAEARLPGGLRVVAVRRAGVPLVEVRLRVPFAGTDLAAAALLSDTLLTGTATRSRSAIAGALQAMGGSLSASVDADRLALGGSALSRDLPDLLGLLAELLSGAAYPAEEVEGERARLGDRLAVALSQPARLARDRLLARCYGDHPYGRELPEPAEIAAVDPETVRALHAQRVAPEGSLLLLVGDLDPDDALDAVAGTLEGWKGGEGWTNPPGEVDPPPPPPVVAPLLVDRPGAVQTTIRMGGTAPARDDQGYAAAKLANLVFGGYFSSRLVANIRERRGYTYSPRSGIEHAHAGSLLTVAADVATEVTAPAMVEIGYELGRITSLPVGDDELEAARRYATGSLALSTATSAGLASTLAALLQVGLGLDYLHDHPRDLATVTVDDVRAAARELLAPSRLVTVLLGDAERTAEDLAALTPLERA
jgi:zinc protease